MNQLRSRAIELCWWILEQKLFYYHPEYGKCVSDIEYDEKETEYKLICEKLSIEPTASNNVGFPFDSPSGKLVFSKFNKLNRFKENAKIVYDFEKEFKAKGLLTN